MPHPNTKLALVALGALIAVGCAIPDATQKTKKLLSEHGTIDGEWTVGDEAGGKTFTYVLLRTKSGGYETYELAASDGQRAVTREQVGGIDSTGCFLLPYGKTSAWILPRTEALQGARESGEKTRTACLEYKDTPGWSFIPEKDRKAAEPPPPPAPEPAATPDAGTPEGGETTAPGDVKSALPL